MIPSFSSYLMNIVKTCYCEGRRAGNFSDLERIEQKHVKTLKNFDRSYYHKLTSFWIILQPFYFCLPFHFLPHLIFNFNLLRLWHNWLYINIKFNFLEIRNVRFERCYLLVAFHFDLFRCCCCQVFESSEKVLETDKGFFVYWFEWNCQSLAMQTLWILNAYKS